jgi:hypothetical protein
MFVRWLVWVHVLSIITFFLGHGAGAAMAFRIRKETNPESPLHLSWFSCCHTW